MARNFVDLMAAAGLQAVDIRAQATGCDLWEVTAQNAFVKTSLYVLHLKHDATWQAATELAPVLSRTESNQLFAIVDPTCRLIRDRSRLQKEFHVGSAFDRKQFLGNALKQVMFEEAQRVEELDAFIEPMLEYAGEQERNGRSFLTQWLIGKVQTPSRLGVLVADGGVGKTTMARNLRNHVLKMRSDQTIPLLTESRHWSTLSEVPELSNVGHLEAIARSRVSCD